jgi:hypothetical protein
MWKIKHIRSLSTLTNVNISQSGIPPMECRRRYIWLKVRYQLICHVPAIGPQSPFPARTGDGAGYNAKQAWTEALLSLTGNSSSVPSNPCLHTSTGQTCRFRKLPRTAAIA